LLRSFKPYSIDVATGQTQELFNDPLTRNLAWSPDGNQIALSSADTVILNRNMQVMFSLSGDAATWSPTGDRIATLEGLSEKITIRIFDVITGDWVKTIETEGCTRGSRMVWSPDGHYLALVGRPCEQTWGNTLYVVNIETSSFTQVTDGTLVVDSPSWVASGEWLVYSALSDDVHHRLRFVRRDGVCELEPLDLEDIKDPMASWQGDKIAFMHDFDLYILDLRAAFAPRSIEEVLTCP
jgi:Tol biopolymer transport system component